MNFFFNFQGWSVRKKKAKKKQKKKNLVPQQLNRIVCQNSMDGLKLNNNGNHQFWKESFLGSERLY